MRPTKPLILACLISLSSCQKELKQKIKPSNAPSFAHIDQAHIFSAQDRALVNEASIKQNIKTYYQNFWEASDLSGGFLVAKGDKIIFEQYRGFAQEGKTEPITAQTPMHVASVSKSLTAMMVLKLVEYGKIKLDQPLSDLFPRFPYKDVSIRDLLAQRSGLPKYEYFIEKLKLNKDKMFSNKDILHIICEHQPEIERPTNTGFMYCNTNYALLALVVEHVTHKSFPAAMQTLLFEPLGMKNSYILTENKMQAAAKSFYSQWRVYPYNHLDLIYGDKNVYTTPRDLLQFSKAMYAKNFLSPELMAEVFEPHSLEKNGVNNYGFGFRMKVFSPEKKLTYHNGWWHGTNSVFGHLLNSKVSIIAIGNKYSGHYYKALSLAALFEPFPMKVALDPKILKTAGNTAVQDSLGTGE
jgi:CubicO group peptidase (beta-lactamase class C family)